MSKFLRWNCTRSKWTSSTSSNAITSGGYTRTHTHTTPVLHCHSLTQQTVSKHSRQSTIRQTTASLLLQSKKYYLICIVAFSALTLLVGWQEEHPDCKIWGDGGGGHWLVRMEWQVLLWHWLTWVVPGKRP